MNLTGHKHPLTQIMAEVNAIFAELGFVFAEGPELEEIRYNFDLLNVPKDHPSRDSKIPFI